METICKARVKNVEQEEIEIDEILHGIGTSDSLLKQFDNSSSSHLFIYYRSIYARLKV